MSLILGALGGAGGAMQDAGSAMLKNDLDTQRQVSVATATSDLELQRQKALEDYKVAEGNQQRELQSQRISTAAQPIIAGQLGAKYAQSDSAVAAADAGQTDAPLTDEQKAAIAQSKQLDADKLVTDPKIRMQAAITTGDISPEKAATLSQGAELGQAKLESALAVANVRGDAMMQVAQARAEAMNARTQAQYEAAMAKLQGAIDKAGGGNTDFDKKVKLLKDSGASPTDLANFVMERKQPSLEDLATKIMSDNPRLTPDAALAKAKTLRDLTRQVTAAPDPATPPPAAPLKALPDGAQQIGTSGGKPVYQLPNGTRFIQQ